MELIPNTLGKQYRRNVWGLRGFSLKVAPGILGLLGPNGAGKSTLMNILATITRPTEGSVFWNGVDIVHKPDGLRFVLGYLPQSFGVYPNLSAQDFLEYMAAIKGLEGRTSRKRIDELLQLVNLTEVRKRPLGGYSGGMKQRIGIARAFLNDPQLLIMDEPTVGLDPEERVRFRNLIADLAGERIVILSTHIVSDVEATATPFAWRGSSTPMRRERRSPRIYLLISWIKIQLNINFGRYSRRTPGQCATLLPGAQTGSPHSPPNPQSCAPVSSLP